MFCDFRVRKGTGGVTGSLSGPNSQARVPLGVSRLLDQASRNASEQGVVVAANVCTQAHYRRSAQDLVRGYEVLGGYDICMDG